MLKARLYVYSNDSVGCHRTSHGEADVLDDDLPSIFGISTVNLGEDATAGLAQSEVALGESVIEVSIDYPATLGEVRISLSKSTKSKCARCWKHRADGEELCKRCAAVTNP